MKKIAAIAAAIALMTGICPAYAVDSMPIKDEPIELNGVSPQVLTDSISMDILSADNENYGIMLASEDDEDTLRNPYVSSVEKAELTGTVDGGKIIEKDHIAFDNGESASVYTVTLGAGSYTIDGFSASCSYGDEYIVRDFNIPEISDTDITINIVVNRPEADITISTLKSNGSDSFDGKGNPYTYEIVSGNAEDWKLRDNGHTIEEYIGPEVDELVIPNTIDGKNIKAIENSTLIEEGKLGTIFGECIQSRDSNGKYIYTVNEKAKSVKISDGIQTIGSEVFLGCDGLKGELKIPSSVRIIGWYAFYKCSGLTGELDLSKCAVLYPYSFAYCKGLTGGLDLSSCIKLYQYAFKCCTGLKGELKLSDSLTSIPDGAFMECPLSGVLDIPEGVTSIGEFAFGLSESSAGFTSLKLPSTLKTIGAIAFQNQSKLSGELVLPEGLTYIGDFAFDHCSSFTNTSLTIPSTVTTIGGDNGVDENTGYGGHVFYDAFPKSTEFKVGEGSKSFKAVDGVLYSIDGTRLVSYPEGKTDTSYVIPDKITQIDEMALGKTKIEELTLPDSLEITKEIPENIINQDGNNLAVGLYSENNCKNVRVYDTNERYVSEDGIIYSADGTELWYVPTKHEGVKVKDSCTTIRNGAFYGKPSINNWTNIYIPASVTLIESDALDFINRSGASIKVSEDNTVYTVNSKGKIVKK